MPARSHRSEASKPRTADQSGQILALVSIFVGVGLSVAKIVIGLRAGSTAVASDGYEAGGDVLSSAIVYGGLLLASKPADAEHPYGHGRYETLAGLAVGAFLLLTGAAILFHGFTSSSAAGEVAGFALYPVFAGIVLKTGLAGLKLRVSKRLRSEALRADAWHDLTDLVSTFVALIAVVLTIFDRERFHRADQVGGIVIGFIIVLLSVKVVRRTVMSLLDTMPEPEKMEEIRRAALEVPGALGVEKCYARRTGLKYHVDLHLEVDPQLTVRESHDIATAVKNVVKARVQWVADVLVHVEPSGMFPQVPVSGVRR